MDVLSSELTIVNKERHPTADTLTPWLCHRPAAQDHSAFTSQFHNTRIEFDPFVKKKYKYKGKFSNKTIDKDNHNSRNPTPLHRHTHLQLTIRAL